MFEYKKRVEIALDIGSSKIACVVGEVSQSGRVTLLGLQEESFIGWRKGCDKDVELSVTAIRNIVEAMHSTVGTLPNKFRVGFSSSALIISKRKIEINFSELGHKISKEDICKSLKLLRNMATRENYKIMHVIPTSFVIDNQLIKEPLNQTGKTLAIEAMVIAVDSETVDNLLMLLRLAGIKVKDVILSCLASADAELNATEKEFGAVYVDIGGQTTGIAVYSHGYIKDMVVLPIGSDYITGDLAVGLGISLANADRIKIALGVSPEVNAAEVIEPEFIKIEGLKGTELKHVSCRLAVDIIEARVNEILAMVKENVDRISCKGLFPTGVVLCGGGARLSGLVQVAQMQLDLPVRRATSEVSTKSGVNTEYSGWGVLGLIEFRGCTKFEKPLPGRQKNYKSHKVLTSFGFMSKLKWWDSILEVFGRINGGRVIVLKRFNTFWVKK